MKLNRYTGMLISLTAFIFVVLLATFGEYQTYGYLPGGLNNIMGISDILFTFTSLFIPAFIASLSDALSTYATEIIFVFSFIEFTLVGYFIGKSRERKK